MNWLAPGSEIDGWRIGECVHPGHRAQLYRVTRASGAPDPGFPLLMKVPRMGEGADASDMVNFEIEHQVLQALVGPHVPRFVAAGDLEHLPYLVMEEVEGRTLQFRADQPALPVIEEVIFLGAALAQAVHSLHQQNTVHLDLQPAHVLVRGDGQVVLLGLGLARHAHYPDLLAGQPHPGSPAWIAPEQVLGGRGDPRSDIFAIGVILYQLLTHALPFGMPETGEGLRQRLWRDPPPPRALRPETPPWLQEVVLRCLAPEAAQRYPSAAHLAFDLQHPQQVRVSRRGEAQRALGPWGLLRRRLRAARMHYRPGPIPARQIVEVPIVMVAVPADDSSDATLHGLRAAAERALGSRPGARLACVTVVARGSGTRGDTGVQRRYQTQLRHWAQPIERTQHPLSLHVLEAGDVAPALLDFARAQRVTVIVMGAPERHLPAQTFSASVPARVAMDAPCTVVLVRQSQHFELPATLTESGA